MKTVEDVLNLLRPLSGTDKRAREVIAALERFSPGTRVRDGALTNSAEQALTIKSATMAHDGPEPELVVG